MNSQHDTTWEIADILKLFKLIKLLIKILDGPLFYGLFGQPNIDSCINLMSINWEQTFSGH